MEKQKELTEQLIRASEAYYNGNIPLMTDKQFDELLDTLKAMEEQSGIVLENSPTVKVGAIVDSLKKVKHEYPALSLNKIKYKDKEDIYKWLETVDNEAVMSLKLDGLTVVATYNNGKLEKAVTRGDGTQGSDVTHNAVFFKGLPRTIDFKNKLIIRGECTMTTQEFKRINELVGDIYENPRNLASATIQMLDSNQARKREIVFTAFDVVSNTGFFNEELDRIKDLGINTVDYELVNKDNILPLIEEWKEKIKNIDIPTDGLVFTSRNIGLYNKLGNTGHHPRGAIALKWTDETKTTIIRDIEWSLGRTGIVTPVAIFDKVRLGLGSNVTKASLHNLSIMEKLGLKINSNAEVFLSNMIIPQIASIEDTEDSIDVEVPKTCPSCGKELTIKENNGIKTLHCLNKDCPKQNISNILNTFSNDGLFVKGLGESQIEDMLKTKVVTNKISDFYNLPKELPEELKELNGWGSKKWSNILKGIEESRKTTLPKFLVALNVPLLGNDLSKKMTTLLGSPDKFKLILTDNKELDDFIELMKNTQGIGPIKTNLFYEWANTTNIDEILALMNELEFEDTSEGNNNDLQGLIFVITGSVHEFKNRKEFKAYVESKGGKVTGSVSKNTNYLVINDLNSTTSKANKARELNVPLISEDEFIEQFGRE